MKQTEFILEYTLRQGHTPTYKMLEELIRKGCFEDATPDTILHKDKVVVGSHIILNNPIKISRNLTLPVGFVVEVTRVSHETDIEEHYRISFSCNYDRSIINANGESERLYSKRQESHILFYPQDFSVVSLPCSTLFAEEVEGRGVKNDGTPTKSYTYSFQL